MNDAMIPDLEQETFRRVWRKVMPQDRADCPFTLEAPQTALPAPREQTRPLCLGEESAPALPALLRFLAETLGLEQTYRALSRRAGPQGGFLLRLAGEKRRQAQRLAAAGFLIAGRPGKPVPVPAVEQQSSSLPLALRACYQAEQGLASALMESAGEVSDPCLIALYRDLGTQDQAAAGQIRESLETVLLTGGPRRSGPRPRR